MKINKKIVDELHGIITDLPYETGGILGSSELDTITDIIIDTPKSSTNHICVYEPNIDYLNICIHKWFSNGIQFAGMFHTHFANVETLSEADKKYISDIMNSIPEEINYLFFPIYVLPDRKIVAYRAEREDNKIKIKSEQTEIV